MRKLMMPGYEPDTDTVDRSSDYLFGHGVEMAIVKRGNLRAVLPSVALLDPWPEEFLWRPLKALGVLDVWWSMYRSDRYQLWALNSVYETADRGRFTQQISREMVADRVAWESYQPHVFASFLVEWQRASEKKASAALERWDEQRVVWRCPEPGCDEHLYAGGVVDDESDAEHAAEFAQKHSARCTPKVRT
ncbi:MAG TPA: hypothetical protein VHX38_23915 [Pseudonocardiaceae bacterium]|nr:hypothetical protein [Pseudonocardiaceae bacterium]